MSKETYSSSSDEFIMVQPNYLLQPCLFLLIMPCGLAKIGTQPSLFLPLNTYLSLDALRLVSLLLLPALDVNLFWNVFPFAKSFLSFKSAFFQMPSMIFQPPRKPLTSFQITVLATQFNNNILYFC